MPSFKKDDVVVAVPENDDFAYEFIWVVCAIKGTPSNRVYSVRDSSGDVFDCYPSQLTKSTQ